MHLGWLQGPIFVVYLFLFVKAYGYLRDHYGTDGGSWLEGFGAFYLAPLVAAFMPFIWLYDWSEQRREAAQVRSGGGPLSLEQRGDRRSLVLGVVVILGFVAVAAAVFVGTAG